eukprot:1150796-Pelagomonas_calceolata.AAC.10
MKCERRCEHAGMPFLGLGSDFILGHGWVHMLAPVLHADKHSSPSGQQSKYQRKGTEEKGGVTHTHKRVHTLWQANCGPVYCRQAVDPRWTEPVYCRQAVDHRWTGSVYCRQAVDQCTKPVCCRQVADHRCTEVACTAALQASCQPVGGNEGGHPSVLPCETPQPWRPVLMPACAAGRLLTGHHMQQPGRCMIRCVVE